MQLPPRAWVNTADELRTELLNREPRFVEGVKKQLRKLGSEYVDKRVAAMGPRVEAAIDCKRCAACCKVLEPELSQNDLSRLAKIENQSVAAFAEIRTDTSNSGKTFLKAAPCSYLQGGACSIYAERPESCADFPHLYRPHFLFRRLIWEHYSLCPIIFNLVELLRDEAKEPTEDHTEIGKPSPST
jgi:Fe-S-cluster containining protein